LPQLANEIEGESKGGEDHTIQEELRAIDKAIAAVVRGEIATDAEVSAALAEFRTGRRAALEHR
jgi:hypothetical protein